MLSLFPTSVIDAFLRIGIGIGIAASRQPRLRHLHLSTPRLVRNPDMSQNVESDAQLRRPKKLICMPAPILTTRTFTQRAHPAGNPKAPSSKLTTI